MQSVTAGVRVLDPVEFVQPDRRLFIDTNIFMDSDPRRAGGVRSLFERCQGVILETGNSIVVPTKVVDELSKQSRRRTPAETDDRAAAAVAKAGAALRFLKDASAVGLVRTDLGDGSNPYADDLFLRLFERFSPMYEMCLLTRDITVKMRIRLLSHHVGKRLLTAELTKDGGLEIESDQSLFDRGVRKHARHDRNVSEGNGSFQDRSEVAALGSLLEEFRATFEVERRETGGAQGSGVASAAKMRRSAVKPFAAGATIVGQDGVLGVTRVPRQDDRVVWESSTENGVAVLGQLLGNGGEGAVYESGHGTVIKVFDEEHITEHRRGKVELLVHSGLRGEGLCIPSAIIRNEMGEFVGYAMPRVHGQEAREIFNIRRLERYFPTWKKSDLVDICISFLEKVEYLHSQNVILGDINPKNLMIDDRKRVFIIDADSWQIEGYPCPVGTPMYTSPRMQSKTYAEDLRTFEDEYFSVATMLFQIVMTGQFPYVRTGVDGNIVSLIREGNFAFQYGDRNNKDQPDGDWKYLWSHIYKPVKDLFWHTFHREGTRYDSRPTATEWLEAFRNYRAYLSDSRLSFDPMSNDVRPIRFKAFRPDTPIQDCPECGRRHAIAGIWNDEEAQYFIPKRCNKCRGQQQGRSAHVRTTHVRPAAVPVCKECSRGAIGGGLTYGRCRPCAARAASLDERRLCADCYRPFITRGHVVWFEKRSLSVPKSHSAIKEQCPSSVTIPPGAAASVVKTAGLWSRIRAWFKVS